MVMKKLIKVSVDKTLLGIDLCLRRSKKELCVKDENAFYIISKENLKFCSTKIEKKIFVSIGN